MDQFLTNLYGTNSSGETVEPADEMEKMAQYRLLEKIAADEGVDLEQLTEEEVEELATELASDLAADDETPDDGQVNQESSEADGGEAELEKEAQAKFEESDFLGRVMAHAMWQELGEIEKTAGVVDKGKELASGGYQAIRRALGAARAKTTGRVADAVLEHAKGPHSKKLYHAIGGASKETPKSLMTWKRGRGRAGAAVEAGTAALGLGALGAGGYGVHRGVKALRGSKEKSSAFNQLVEDRAYQHLMAAGLADDQGNFVTPDQLQKSASAADIDTQVDRAALEYLQGLGYPVEWYNQ